MMVETNSISRAAFVSKATVFDDPSFSRNGQTTEGLLAGLGGVSGSVCKVVPQHLSPPYRVELGSSTLFVLAVPEI